MERLRKIGFSKLTLLDDALKKLFDLVKINPNEEINVNNCLNRILAEDIVSKIDIPPFNRSAMDGYAIKAKDSFGASPKNPKTIKLVGSIEIGESSQLKLQNSEGIRISTGAPLPEGADAVIKIEDTEIDNDIINLFTSLVPGKNVAKTGEDIKQGNKILDIGLELKSEHIALLSSLGYKNVKVKVKPKISVFSTGNELVEPGNPLEPGKIYNSNTPMISNLVRLYGGILISEATLKDDKELIKTELFKASKTSQIVVFTGGTSVGTKDLLPEVIHENGTILTHGIAMRPGSPILIGLLDDTIIFCLPGTPVAAYVGFLKIVGPTIRKMMDCSNFDLRIEVIASIDRDVPVSSMGYINYLRVKLNRLENQIIAIPVKLKGSGVISSLTESDGIVEIPSIQEGLKKGEKVVVKLHPK